MQQNLQRENCVNWCKKCNVCFDVSASEIGLLLIDSGPSFSFSEAMHCVSWWSQLSSRFLAIRCHFRTSAECKAVESKLSSALAIDILYIEWKYSRTFKDNPDCKRTVTIFTVFMVCPSEAFNQGTGRNERLLGSLRAKSVQRARHTFKEKTGHSMSKIHISFLNVIILQIHAKGWFCNPRLWRRQLPKCPASMQRIRKQNPNSIEKGTTLAVPNDV